MKINVGSSGYKSENDSDEPNETRTESRQNVKPVRGVLIQSVFPTKTVTLGRAPITPEVWPQAVKAASRRLPGVTAEGLDQYEPGLPLHRHHCVIIGDGQPDHRELLPVIKSVRSGTQAGNDNNRT